MEDNPLFNAGKGSVFTSKGNHEMDASLMDGNKLKAGAVSAVQGIKNPILFAKEILARSKHVMLAGEEALEFARVHNLEFQPLDYFYDDFRYNQWIKAKKQDKISLDHDGSTDHFGTVGAVVLDRRGNLAAGTSTGGMVNKQNGRVGDSPIIGAGTYADNSCAAVSCTGHGEFFIRLVAAHEVISMIRFQKISLEEASNHFIHKKLKSIGGRGGLVAVDNQGNISMPFNTKGMYRACKKENEPEFIGIY
jgi:beta-aspartyl-peptidase (threonine type)